ncbi:c-type cytochrome [Woeseia oceani]|uniref:Cytochrome c domain-containing protein n=1 Tax=Woeseia oceani TaxID=1548547 RepID=A0A193LCS8_9GAMM|nr:cytochrome c [Woeseia oceani]ANO50273.1 hypothetical protein BA177_02705 [Woeseia oceani]
MLSALRYALVLALLVSSQVFADDRTIADGVYTDAQAESGEALYEQHCLICHDKKYFRPVLKRWEGQPLGMMYLIMSSSMPESNPASLRQQEYVDILAYVLSLSRYPSGDTALDYQDGALDKITVVPRKR